MTRIIEDDVIDVISPDDWADVIAKDRESIRRELNRMINEFKRNGGKIQKMEHGATAGFQNGFTIKAVPKVEFDPVVQEKHRQKKLAAHMKRQAGDKEKAERLDKLLDTVKTTTGLVNAMGVARYCIQRLLRDFFPDDPRADKYRQRCREQRSAYFEAETVKAVRAALAAGMQGRWAIAKHCNVSFATLIEVCHKHRIDIPKAPHWNTGGKDKT